MKQFILGFLVVGLATSSVFAKSKHPKAEKARDKYHETQGQGNAPSGDDHSKAKEARDRYHDKQDRENMRDEKFQKRLDACKGNEECVKKATQRHEERVQRREERRAEFRTRMDERCKGDASCEQQFRTEARQKWRETREERRKKREERQDAPATPEAPSSQTSS